MQETLRNLAASALAFLALSGCTVGPNFARPPDMADERFTQGAAVAAARPPEEKEPAAPPQAIAYGQDLPAQWWTLYRCAALNALVANALSGNRTLTAMQATLAASEEFALATTGALQPQVTLTGGVGRQKYGAEFLGGKINLPPFTYFAVGPNISYTLDYNGGMARAVEREYALVDLTRQQLNAAYLSVTGQTVMETIAAASAFEQIAMVETLLTQDRDNLHLVKGAFEAGSVARIDVLSAQSQIDSDMTLLPPLRHEFSRARHALLLLVGRTPAGTALPDIDLAALQLPESVPVGIPSELAHRRPDILQAEAQLHAATSAVGIAQSNLYPKIQITASIAQEALRPSRLVNGSATAWSLAGGFTAPLFDGGSLRAQQRAAVDELHAGAANYEQAVLEAFGQVADLLDALQHDTEQLSAQNESQSTAHDALELARASYSEGNVGILQVLDAQRVYQQSRLGQVRATAQRYLDTTQLILALGGSNPAPGPVSAVAAKTAHKGAVGAAGAVDSD